MDSRSQIQPVLAQSGQPEAEPSAAVGPRLSDDQFWALERWIIASANAAAMPGGFYDPAQHQAIRDTAYTALTGKEPS